MILGANRLEGGAGRGLQAEVQRRATPLRAGVWTRTPKPRLHAGFLISHGCEGRSFMRQFDGGWPVGRATRRAAGCSRLWPAGLRPLRVNAAVIAIAAILAVLAGGAARGVADDGGSPAVAALPARVHVAADETYLRAGPSNDFYPTGRLTRGDVVELWDFDASGYAAVRPVEGSFSWIRADDLQLLDEAADTATPSETRRVGVVLNDGVISRIGSQLNPCRHAAQVRLEAGERVSVIDTVTTKRGRYPGTWMRIEPPSGEFRWVWAHDLVLPPGIEPPAAPREQSGITLVSGQLDSLPAAPRELDPPRASPIPAAPARDVIDDTPWYTRWMPQGSSVFEPWNRPVTGSIEAGAMAASGDELDDIDLELSLAVAAPEDQWNLTPLRERLNLTSARSTTHQERLRADALDARLARFESIQARRAALDEEASSTENQLRLGSLWSSISALGSRPVRPGVLPGGAPANGQPTWTPPDAVETTGRLATVVSRRPDAPRWALVDASNQVLVFVSPADSLNLAPLVGQEVAIRGARGYMPEYRKPYLVATEARLLLAAAPPSSTDTQRR